MKQLRLWYYLIIYLTPCIPLSFKGEGEDIKRGASAPLKHSRKWGYNVDEGENMSILQRDIKQL